MFLPSLPSTVPLRVAASANENTSLPLEPTRFWTFVNPMWLSSEPSLSLVTAQALSAAKLVIVLLPAPPSIVTSPSASAASTTAASITTASSPPPRLRPTSVFTFCDTITLPKVATSLVLRTSMVPAIVPAFRLMVSFDAVATTVRPTGWEIPVKETAVSASRLTRPELATPPAANDRAWTEASACSSTVTESRLPEASLSSACPVSVPLSLPVGENTNESMPPAPPVRFSTPVKSRSVSYAPPVCSVASVPELLPVIFHWLLVAGPTIVSAPLPPVNRIVPVVPSAVSRLASSDSLLMPSPRLTVIAVEPDTVSDCTPTVVALRSLENVVPLSVLNSSLPSATRSCRWSASKLPVNETDAPESSGEIDSIARASSGSMPPNIPKGWLRRVDGPSTVSRMRRAIRRTLLDAFSRGFRPRSAMALSHRIRE